MDAAGMIAHYVMDDDQLLTANSAGNTTFLATLDSSAELARLREAAVWSVNISAAVIAGIYVWDIIHSIRMARQLREEPSARNIKSLLTL